MQAIPDWLPGMEQSPPPPLLYQRQESEDYGEAGWKGPPCSAGMLEIQDPGGGACLLSASGSRLGTGISLEPQWELGVPVLPRLLWTGGVEGCRAGSLEARLDVDTPHPQDHFLQRASRNCREVLLFTALKTLQGGGGGKAAPLLGRPLQPPALGLGGGRTGAPMAQGLLFRREKVALYCSWGKGSSLPQGAWAPTRPRPGSCERPTWQGGSFPPPTARSRSMVPLCTALETLAGLWGGEGAPLLGYSMLHGWGCCKDTEPRLLSPAAPLPGGRAAVGERGLGSISLQQPQYQDSLQPTWGRYEGKESGLCVLRAAMAPQSIAAWQGLLWEDRVQTSLLRPFWLSSDALQGQGS